MTDIAALTEQLVRLKETLQHKQRELDGMSAACDAERARSIQFIGRLMQRCRGHDRELDSRLAKLRQRLDDRPSLSSLDGDLAAIEALLQQHSHVQEASRGEAQAAIALGHRQLQAIDGFSPETRQALQVFLASPPGYGTGDQQRRVLRLLEFYQQALSLQPAQPDAVQGTSPFDARLHARIADELQRLITELDFAGTVGEKLAEIRRQLLDGLTPPFLAEICLQVIEQIIEGTREERKSSLTFLGTLNENLSATHLRFTESLDEGRALQNASQLSYQAFDGELQAMEHALASHDSLAGLQLALAGPIGTIRSLQQARQVMAGRERHLLAHLSHLEAKLRLMKEETAEYKKRLTIQKHKLFLDSLTQVHNRAALDERLDLEYKRWLRYGTPLCLAIVDIDHFKQINDNYGHMAGDKALKVVAKALQSALRDTDFIARFGGEEFVVLLPNINPDKYQKPLENLRQAIKSIPFRFRDAGVDITVSIGATLFREGDHTTDAFERADRALYEAKHAGRDRVQLA